MSKNNGISSEGIREYFINKTQLSYDEDEIIKKSLKILDKRIRTGEIMSSPDDVYSFLRVYFSGYEHEVFAVIYLDSGNQVISIVDEFRGTINEANVYPREVLKEALKHNASSVILAHNHPSGISDPSISDEKITKKLKEALSLVDIAVLDHFVVGDEVVSFAKRGLI